MNTNVFAFLLCSRWRPSLSRISQSAPQPSPRRASVICSSSTFKFSNFLLTFQQIDMNFWIIFVVWASGLRFARQCSSFFDSNNIKRFYPKGVSNTNKAGYCALYFRCPERSKVEVHFSDSKSDNNCFHVIFVQMSTAIRIC